MILARLLPKDSKKYQSIRDNIGKYSNFFDKYNITHFFGIWTMTISGYSYLLGQIDRFELLGLVWIYEWNYEIDIINYTFFLFIPKRYLGDQ